MNHRLLQLKDRPQWRTIIGGSKSYVDKIKAELTGKIRLNTHIKSISRTNGKVMVSDIHGQVEEYDHVVFACHSDQALKLLSDATSLENDLLSCFPYQKNQAILHLDKSLMPKRNKVWSSWNYLASGDKKTEQQVSVSYWMNKLQPLNTEVPIFVSLNPIKEPNPDSIIRSFFYEHPTFNQSSFKAQKKLWQLQGKQNTWFCGAYFGYGFHEDGLQSGLAVAEALGGIKRPWLLKNQNNRIHVSPINISTESTTSEGISIV
jgi:predicted NAD/FAD-binding protein